MDAAFFWGDRHQLKYFVSRYLVFYKLVIEMEKT